MTSSLALLVLCAVLVGVGVYLLLERSLTRIILGLACLSNGVNIAFLVAGGPSANPPIVGQAPKDSMADPLVQAMMLTAIVITLGVSAFLLAMAYRSWQLNGNDEVQDDVEDKLLARRLDHEELRRRTESAGTLDDVAQETHDDTEMHGENATIADGEMMSEAKQARDRDRRRRATIQAWQEKQLGTAADPSSTTLSARKEGRR